MGRNNAPPMTSTKKKLKKKDLTESKMEAKEEETPPSKTSDQNMFAESTIGSSSLPISLTPINPSAAVSAHRHPSTQMQSFAPPQHQTLMSQSHNFSASALQSMHATTARSPFLGNTAGTGTGAGSGSNGLSRHSYGSYTTNNVNLAGGVGGGGGGGQSMYGGNAHVDMMRYPVSSSSGNGNGNGNGFVPRIQQMELGSNTTSSGNIPSSGGGGSSAADDPDNTLNFINELKEMLKSTDQLLKAKPASLYDNM